MSATWAVVPAYNEGKRIGPVVRAVRTHCPCVVVDDGSPDDTSAIAKRAGAAVLRHVVNLGKGAAMRTGAEYAIAHGAKRIIFLDGDGQHDPAEIPLFIAQLKRGKQVVFGARRMKTSMPIERQAGRWLIRRVIRTIYGYNLHDPLCGYRAMTARAYARIRWRSRDYSVESEMIARAGRESLPYAEVDISTIYHDRFKGMTIVDGLKIVLHLVWWRMTH